MKRMMGLFLVFCILFVCPVSLHPAFSSGELLSYDEAIQRLNNISLTDVDELDLISRSFEAVGNRYFAQQYWMVSELLMILAYREFTENEDLSLYETGLKMLFDGKAFKEDYLSHSNLAYLPLDSLLSYIAARKLEAEGKTQEAFNAYAQAQVLDSLERGLRLMVLEPTAQPAQKAEGSEYMGQVNPISYGRYEQDNNLANGKEEIVWRVLAQEKGLTLLISEKNLDCQPYHAINESVNWENCTLREWLNSDFLNDAFTAEEQKSILTTQVKNEGDPAWGTHSEMETSDKIFLLSAVEAKEYFLNDNDRTAYNTAYAQALGADDSGDGSGYGTWWLRSRGQDPNLADLAYLEGHLYCASGTVTNRTAVRPAMWVDLSGK